MPPLVQFSPLNPFSFFLSSLEPVQYYIGLTLFFLILSFILIKATRQWTQKPWIAFLITLVVNIALTGINATDFFNWLCIGASGGTILFFLYYFIIRSNLALIPAVTFSIVILSEAKQATMKAYTGQAYSGSTAYFLFSFCLLSVISVFWYFAICKSRLNQSCNPSAI
jgi:hypothetical protein